MDAGVGHVLDEAQAVHGPPADAVDGGDHQGVSRLQPGPKGLQGLQALAVAPGARADLGDDLVHAVVLELLGLRPQVALVLGGLADPGEADGEGKAVGHRQSMLPALSECGNRRPLKRLSSRVSAGRPRS